MGLIFGTYLRLLRIDRGMSLRQVEKITKISNSYLSQIEKGKRDIPTYKILSRLAKAYGVEISSLIKVAEDEGGNIKPFFENIIPGDYYISREYNLLSDSRKKVLKEFLQYLVEQEIKSMKEE